MRQRHGDARSVERVLSGAELCTKLAFEQFAAGVLGQGIDEEDLFGRLVPGQVCAAVGDEVILG